MKSGIVCIIIAVSTIFPHFNYADAIKLDDGSTALESVEAYDVIADTGWNVKTNMPRARFGFGATKLKIE